MRLFLTSEELEELTGRKRRKEQSETLTAMGIRWKTNAAGELIVGRSHVEKVLCGDEHSQQRERTRPNLEALGQ
ncbi:DUF4224 domain-containing protein [Halomonas elongata]|uniref:DUF4224 domain-containing protein n=1 Tax=Halomonas elongata (strain ATCC 33173 / DSM 2581 / NBRC 15536 / NCIMB 2198 / 1H9) TaxID=768066 RepID=A0ABZ0TF94_HALED|nr:DUF4224 domain-containing protein [Halomonas elongata]MBW5800632.1 DUF4224 domain-containing protein [Halomonas elongata]WBF19843.1 DUF4224 domain-containing protein [Halomonas elongata]WPU48713.1 DUF4224 domain-containing protein [Halomonas elongata DSM 2581]